VLSTLSKKLGGYPFGSMVPFMLDHAARPVIYISRLAEQKPEIVAHMNADHVRSLRAFCRHFRQVSAHDANMVGIDCDGFDARADGELLRFDFEQPATDAADARRALVSMATSRAPDEDGSRAALVSQSPASPGAGELFCFAYRKTSYTAFSANPTKNLANPPFPSARAGPRMSSRA
jgi:putative heme iron utilization protein